jgi:transposase
MWYPRSDPGTGRPAGQPDTARTGWGQTPAFDREAYKQRNTVERCINRLKQWRGIATRCEKTETIYLAGLHVTGIFRWSLG